MFRKRFVFFFAVCIFVATMVTIGRRAMASMPQYLVRVLGEPLDDTPSDDTTWWERTLRTWLDAVEETLWDDAHNPPVTFDVVPCGNSHCPKLTNSDPPTDLQVIANSLILQYQVVVLPSTDVTSLKISIGGEVFGLKEEPPCIAPYQLTDVDGTLPQMNLITDETVLSNKFPQFNAGVVLGFDENLQMLLMRPRIPWFRSNSTEIGFDCELLQLEWDINTSSYKVPLQVLSAETVKGYQNFQDTNPDIWDLVQLPVKNHLKLDLILGRMLDANDARTTTLDSAVTIQCITCELSYKPTIPFNFLKKDDLPIGGRGMYDKADWWQLLEVAGQPGEQMYLQWNDSIIPRDIFALKLPNPPPQVYHKIGYGNLSIYIPTNTIGQGQSPWATGMGMNQIYLGVFLNNNATPMVVDDNFEPKNKLFSAVRISMMRMTSEFVSEFEYSVKKCP